MKPSLQDIIKDRILILNGAMGTMIQSMRLPEHYYRGLRFAHLSPQTRGTADMLCLTHPEVIEGVHRKYMEAGADLLTTCTFSAQRVSMSHDGMEAFCREINLEAARIARRVADEYTEKTPQKPRYVLGGVGPTGQSLSISPDVRDPAARSLTFDELCEAYTEQMEALLEGGVDALLVETLFDTLNAKAATCAAQRAMEAQGREVPIMLSATVSDTNGRLLSGQTIEAFYASVAHCNPFSVGLNCSFGARQLKPVLRRLAAVASCYVSANPNAGLPNEFGEYSQTPEDVAGQIGEYIQEGLVNIVGGCCGTTDAHIRLLPHIVETAVPREPAHTGAGLTLSGLEPLHLAASSPGAGERVFVTVGERCNVAGSKKFLRLISAGQYDEALSIARLQVENGAQVIDVNMDDGLIDARAEMVHFLNLCMSDPDIARVPIMIDSSDWNVIRAGLKCVQGKSVVNSISLKEGEAPFLDHAREIRRLGAAVVVMAFDERGQADTYARKIEVCGRAYRLLTRQAHFPPSDIIFDPGILAVATGIAAHDNYALDFIRATRWIRENLPGAHISGGVSNLSFAFRGNNPLREAMHAVFLHHATREGMDMGILNPATRADINHIPAPLREAIDDVLLNRAPDAADRLAAMASHAQPDGHIGERMDSRAGLAWDGTVDERLSQALIKGVPDHLEEDLREALTQYASPLEIIQKPLMGAMGRVGELFGEGKMFLPQVVKTARTMAQAVDILRPHLSGSEGTCQTAGTVLLATVKGDIHDIGKNIVGLILSCNNYRIIDLGVSVPAAEIVNAAIANRVDIIGLSGLITPSLEEMVTVARMLEERGAHIPVMIGGATTSELHTALKIAPVYSGLTLWMGDASQNVLACAKLMSRETRESYSEEVRQRYRQLCQAHAPGDMLSIEEARKRKPQIF